MEKNHYEASLLPTKGYHSTTDSNDGKYGSGIQRPVIVSSLVITIPLRKGLPLMSPMQRSLNEMRRRGYFCEITENWIKHGAVGYRKDLFGFCDLLCLGENEVIAVQTTSRSNMRARIRKIADSDVVGFVRKAGIRILVQGWDGDKLTEEDVS
jgi:hypothetical protein